MSSMPVLQPRLFLGLQTDVRKGVNYLSELEIIYPAGGVLIAHNYTQKRQRYCYPADKMRKLTCLAISPNRKNIAVADRGEKPTLTIYDAVNLKRKKVLVAPSDTQAKEFQHICFTHDNKYIMAILGEPEWMMISYMWEKGKIDSSYKSFNPQNPGPVLEIQPNPTNSSTVCVVGPGLFRLLQLTENQWKNYGFNKSDTYPLTCACWLTTERVLAGTIDGRLLVVESGELKTVYKAADLQTIDLKSIEPMMQLADDTEINTPVDSVHDISNYSVRELASFPRGFAFVIGLCSVYLFEKEDNYKYLKRNAFLIDIMSEDKLPLLANKANGFANFNAIRTLAVSPNGNSLLVTTGRSQLYTVNLWGPDLHERPEIPFTPLGERLHQGAIVALAICSWKTIFITCGELDHTVRVWNYSTDALELSKCYDVDILSVTLHPTGLFAIVGFSDKLRFMELLIDDIQTKKEFPIKDCKLCKFSKNGHLFAAVDEKLIFIYSSITYEIMHTFKGHIGMVTGLAWNIKDTKLVSCGLDGAFYEWNIPLGKRTAELVDRTCMFRSVSVTSDGKTSYIVGNDGNIREITETQLAHQCLILRDGLSVVVLSRSDLMLFVTGGNGSVISVRFPLTQDPEFNEYHMHNKPVTAMCLSYDDLHLITTSEDGSICLWKLTATEGKTVKLDKDFEFSHNILIPKQELAEKIDTINDLKQHMKELVNDHSLKVATIEEEHEKNIDEINNAYTQAINELKEKIDETGKEHTSELYVINDDIAKLKESQESMVESLQANFKAKLIVEYDKYAALDESTHQMRQKYMHELEELEESKKTSISDLTSDYEARLNEKQLKIEDLRRRAAALSREDEEVNRQIEDDADREIIETKTVYEAKLKEERETIVKLRAEASGMKKKYIGSQKEIEIYKQQIHKLQQQHEKILKVISSHDRAIEDLKREMQERDATIPEKESSIYELKMKNQELEKYKFVLNYKIKELQNQIRPKEIEIEEKKQQMAEMEEELEGLHKINTSLELQTQELREKLTATHNELGREQNENKKNNSTLNRIRLDIHNAYCLISEPRKLKAVIKDLYHKYSLDPAFISSRKAEEDVQEEFMRQRDFLEHTIAVLKKQVKIQSSGGVCETKILEDHAELIEEINYLRRELKNARHHYRDMESIVGPAGRLINPKVAQDKLEAAIKSREEIKQEYEERTKKLVTVNQQLKDEVESLRAKVREES